MVEVGVSEDPGGRSGRSGWFALPWLLNSKGPRTLTTLVGGPNVWAGYWIGSPCLEHVYITL